MEVPGHFTVYTYSAGNVKVLAINPLQAQSQPEEIFIPSAPIDQFKEEPADELPESLEPDEHKAADADPSEAEDEESESEADAAEPSETEVGAADCSNNVTDVSETEAHTNGDTPDQSAFINYFKGLQPDYDELNDKRKEMFKTALEQLLDEQ